MLRLQFASHALYIFSRDCISRGAEKYDQSCRIRQYCQVGQEIESFRSSNSRQRSSNSDQFTADYSKSASKSLCAMSYSLTASTPTIRMHVLSTIQARCGMPLPFKTRVTGARSTPVTPQSPALIRHRAFWCRLTSQPCRGRDFRIFATDTDGTVSCAPSSFLSYQPSTPCGIHSPIRGDAMVPR